MYLQFVVTHALSKQGELALWRPYTIYSPISSEAGMTPSLLQLIYQGRVVIPLFLPLEGPSKSSNYLHHPRFYTYRSGCKQGSRAGKKGRKRRLIICMKSIFLPVDSSAARASTPHPAVR